MSRTRSLLSIVGTVALLVGAGVFVRSTPAASSTGASVAVGTSNYGPILFDGRGFALYAFTADPRKRATCYGDCAKAWPPFIVTRRPTAGRGARSSLIGTTRRSDGMLQATYAGRPLYHYVGDTSPGVVRCQNVPEFGGTWLVLRGGGALVR